MQHLELLWTHWTCCNVRTSNYIDKYRSISTDKTYTFTWIYMVQCKIYVKILLQDKTKEEKLKNKNLKTINEKQKNRKNMHRKTKK